MLRTFIFFTFLLHMALLVCAQTTGFKGTIHDNQGKPLDAVTVALSREGKPVAMLSTYDGSFAMAGIKAGKYQLVVSSVGYDTLKRIIVLPLDTVQLTMKSVNNRLNEVVVTFKKPIIERKIDRVVFNVENSIVANGATIWDALNKAPGVQTTFDGNVKANGKDVLVYMDDKPIRMSGDELSNYLKSLPSDQVAKIEVIANPPSRYDAQGGAVINIVSKKIKTQGLNINVNSAYTQSVYGSYSAGANFNYRKNKVNIYGGYSYTYSKKDHEETEYIIFDTPGNYAYWDNSKKGIRERASNNYKLGLDYNLTDNQVIGFLINGFNGDNQRTNNVATNIYNNHKPTIDSLLKTGNYTAGNTNQYGYNINYKAKLDTSGQTLNLDIDYAPYRNNSNQLVNNLSFLPNGFLASDPYKINTSSKQSIDIWSGKMDYTYTFNKKWNMEAGLKYSSIVTNNHFDFFNDNTDVPILDKNKSDEFKYTENTSAAYVSANGTLGKFSIEAGLRGEYTHTKGYSITLDSVNKNNYFKLFPTLFLTYTLSKDNELNVYYSNRISRPDYWRLNPFKYYTSPYTYLEGNPALKPSYIQNVELGYTYKQQYNFTLFYRETDGYFSNITVQDNVNKIFYDTQQNLDKSIETGFYISVPVNPLEWWEMNNFMQASYKQEKSGYLRGSYDYHTLGLYLNTNQAFVINKKEGLKAEVSAWFSSPSVQGIYHLARTFDVSSGIRKTILNGQGTVRIVVNDIFYGNPYRINVNYLNQHNGFYEKNDTRAISVSFSYKLGKNKIADARKRATSSDDEKKRTGN